MEKVYTKIKGTFVFPNPEDLDFLKPDSCLVRKESEKLCITPLSEVKGKPVETSGNGYHPLWGDLDEDPKPYILIDGNMRDPKFCDLCKNKLNGITGNCFDRNIAPNGCSFDPVDHVKAFQISLDGWKKLRPTDVNKFSGFYTPHINWTEFNSKTIRRNRKMRIVSHNLWEYQEKKIAKYCSRCIYEGTCCLNSQKIIKHCMVTEEETVKQCLQSIRRQYGNAEEFLRLLAYGGKKLMYRPRYRTKESEWRVAHPLKRKKFKIVQPYRYFNDGTVSSKVIEEKVIPRPVPCEDRDKIAALAWYYLKHFHYHLLWISPKLGGIEVAHPTRGSYYFFRRQTFTSFIEILYFFNR